MLKDVSPGLSVARKDVLRESTLYVSAQMKLLHFNVSLLCDYYLLPTYYFK